MYLDESERALSIVSGVKKSRHKRGLTFTSTGQSSLITTSSIPAKFQRVIIRKELVAKSPSPRAASYHHSSSYSSASNTIHAANERGTTVQEMKLEFGSPKRNLRETMQSMFAAADYQSGSPKSLLMFNKSPGPGQYKLVKERPKLIPQDQDTSIQFLKDDQTDQSEINLLTLQKSKVSLIQRNRQLDQEPGTVFPKADRFPISLEDPSPGPQEYDPSLPREKVKGVLKMQTEGSYSIPSHVLNNPLNYVKPLVVNLYYKKGVPDVGHYDVTLPDEIGKAAKNKAKESYKSVFDSQVERTNDFFIVGDKEIVSNKQRTDFYEIQKAEQSLQKVKASMPSFLFQKPIKPVAKLELPDVVRKAVEGDKNQRIQDQSLFDQHPEYYGSIDERQDKLNARQTQVQTLERLEQDRFGQTLFLRKPLEEMPGPGYYHDLVKIEKIRVNRGQTIILPEGKSQSKVFKEEKIPGPGQYRQEVEPKQLSFHYWGGTDMENPRKRGRKRKCDQHFKVLDAEESERLRRRNIETMNAFQKPKRPKLAHQNQMYQAQHYNQGNQLVASQYNSMNNQQVAYTGPYTLERIQKACKKYEKLYEEYKQVGMTYRVKHFLSKIPDVCGKLKGVEMERSQMVTLLVETAKTLLFDEFEIINWVKFLDRFDLKIETFAYDIFFIALATKLLLNPKKKNEPVEIYLSRNNPKFFSFNQWIPFFNPRFYQDHQDGIICHAICRKLSKGLTPAFDPQLAREEELNHMIEVSDFNELVDEMVLNQRSGELSKQNSRGGAGDPAYHLSQQHNPLDLSRNQSKVSANNQNSVRKELSGNSSRSQQLQQAFDMPGGLNLAATTSNQQTRLKDQNNAVRNSLMLQSPSLMSLLDHQLKEFDPQSIDFNNRKESVVQKSNNPFNFSQYDMFGFGRQSQQRTVGGELERTQTRLQSRNDNSQTQEQQSQSFQPMSFIQGIGMAQTVIQFGSQQLQDFIASNDFDLDEFEKDLKS